MPYRALSVTVFAALCACGGSTVGPDADAGSAANPDGGVGIDRTAAADAAAGSAQGVATVASTLAGRPFSVTGALGIFTTPFGPGLPTLVEVLLPLNYDITCDLAHRQTMTDTAISYANQAAVVIIIENAGHQATPGTYTSAAGDSGVPSALTAAATYYQDNANCDVTTTEATTSATVTVSAIDTTAISGTFDLTFPNGDHAKGQFAAPVCVVEPFPDIQSSRALCVPDTGP